MKVIVFDLDDTLYKEVDFVKSGFRWISKRIENEYGCKNVYGEMIHDWAEKKNVFKSLINRYDLNESLSDLVTEYRNHDPDIFLDDTTYNTLQSLTDEGNILGLITDGRSLTQRNKIKALNLDEFFNEPNIVISEEFGSEKPSLNNYQYFMKLYHGLTSFSYIGDNVKKDFIAPNYLRWNTICILDNGMNIHRQSFDLPLSNLPNKIICNLSELTI